MKNRNLSSPILCAIVLSLVVTPPLRSQADPGLSYATPSGPVGQPAPATPTAKGTSTYTVVAGDSWTSLAQKFKTTRKKLKALNNLTATTVKPGQVLQVPFKRKAPGKRPPSR